MGKPPIAGQLDLLILAQTKNILRLPPVVGSHEVLMMLTKEAEMP